MAFFALQYEFVDDFINRRAPYRDEHLGMLRELHARGEVVLAGAFAEPADRALIVFKADDRGAVESFAKRDPYVVNRLVTRWEVRLWNVVVGN
jgi:uncharacterized protein YciI